jgi:hypothetical protein
MTLNNQNETYYHHLQHNSHLKEHTILLTRKISMNIFQLFLAFLLVHHQEYRFHPRKIHLVISSTGPLFSEGTFVPIVGTGCVCQNFHSCLDAASSSDFGALRLLAPALACSAKAICFNKFCTESTVRAYRIERIKEIFEFKFRFYIIILVSR